MRRRAVIAIAATTLFSACSTSPKRTEELSFIPLSIFEFAQRLKVPAVGTATRSNLGEAIIASRNVALLPTLRLQSDTEVIFPYNDSWQVASKLLAGEYRLVARDTSGGKYYRSTRSLPVRFNSKRPTVADTTNEDQIGGIYISSAGDRFAYLHWKNTTNPSSLQSLATLSLDQSAVEIDLPEDQLQKEIIYLGIAQNIISLRYREYWKKMSRPAFDQDLRYDLSLSKTIGFRESRFEIIEATNTYISYKVLSHLI